MSWNLPDAVVDFYYDLFDKLFGQPFAKQLPQRLRRDEVARQVQDMAGAASQSLFRFLDGRKLPAAKAKRLLSEFADLPKHLTRDDIANANINPQNLTSTLLAKLRKGKKPALKGNELAVYSVALNSVVETLCFLGPVLKEWERLQFSRTFEPPRRVVGQLQEITAQMETRSGRTKTSADEDYGLQHRDYLLQRFYRAEVGTVRMTTNMAVDLRQLFVMPMARLTRNQKDEGSQLDLALAELMSLTKARGALTRKRREKEKKHDRPFLDLVRRHERLVVVGRPGSGKSTFVEWFQMLLASGGNEGEEFPLQGEQAMPLLLRVRELDMRKLPSGAALIQRATASKQRADLMPKAWIDRQMTKGVVFVILDGLDEVEPTVRDKVLIPWLEKLIRDHPRCRYLVTSRPVGYDRAQFSALGFAECELLDFEEPQVAEYARHWCTAIRLAQNEPIKEAQEEGKREGEKILNSFKGHAYIRDLASNPLMLSAICLVNYFEKGRLPDDRNLLYQLCVEGLLHHWDHRRGIHSEFGLEEKLRLCREVAFEMQLADKAEASEETVLQIMSRVLGDAKRATKLLEHIRYRTGLLVERRAKVFAFAHLTFQEYLAARAMHEGDHPDWTPQRLAAEHADDRWREVISLYAAQAGVTAERTLVEALMACEDSKRLPAVLEDVLFSCKPEVRDDKGLGSRVIERNCIHDNDAESGLDRFLESEVAPLAMKLVGTVAGAKISGSHGWLNMHPDSINHPMLFEKLRTWKGQSPFQNGELIYLILKHGSIPAQMSVLSDYDLISANGPDFGAVVYPTLAWAAGLGLSTRATNTDGAFDAEQALVCLDVLKRMADLDCDSIKETNAWPFANWISKLELCEWDDKAKGTAIDSCKRLIKLLTAPAKGAALPESEQPNRNAEFVEALRQWLSKLEGPLNVTATDAQP